MSLNNLIRQAGITSLSLALSSFSCGGLAASVTGSRLAPQEREHPTIGGATRVTLPELGPHTWTSLRADPTNSNNLALCALRNSSQTAQSLVSTLYASEDAGATWRIAREVALGDYTSEVACRFDDKGTLLFSFSVSMTRAGQTAKEAKARDYGIVAASDDMGRSWSDSRPLHYLDSVVLIPDSGAARANLVIADDTDFGTYYIAHKGQLQLEGPNPITVADALLSGEYRWVTDGDRMPNGLAGVLLLDPSKDRLRPRRIIIARFDSNGNPLPAKIVAVLDRQQAVSADAQVQKSDPAPYPAMASDPAELLRGNTYVVWHDRIRNRDRILLSVSNDDGETWQPPRVIDDSSEDPSNGLRDGAARPSIAVNNRGVVGIQWVESNGHCWRFSASRDGGQSFSPSIPINSCDARSSKEEASATNLRMFAGGSASILRKDDSPNLVVLNVTSWQPYRNLGRGYGLAANADDSFQSAFTGSGNDRDQLFTARILGADAMPSALKPCVAEESARQEGWLEYTSVRFDRDHREIQIGAVAVMPATAQPRPVRFMVREAVSPYGRVVPVAPDVRFDSGAYGWTFPTGTYAELPPGSAVKEAYRGVWDRFVFSKPRTIRLKVLGDLTRIRQKDPTFSIAKLTGSFKTICPVNGG